MHCSAGANDKSRHSLVVHECVGAAVGSAVGALVGALVGSFVGAPVGLSVGAFVGDIVGAGDGIEAHSDEPGRLLVHMPYAQSWHSWYMVLSWYFPDGQWKQFVLNPVQAL